MAHVPRPTREVFRRDLPIAICSMVKLSTGLTTIAQGRRAAFAPAFVVSRWASGGTVPHAAREVTTAASRTHGALCATSNASGGEARSPNRAFGVRGAAVDQTGPVAKCYRCPLTGLHAEAGAPLAQVEQPGSSRLWPPRQPQA